MNRLFLFTVLLAAFSGAQAETVFRRSNDSEPSTMDPQLAQGMPEMHILRDIFVGLIDEDAGAHIIPGVAERWETSPDNKTYIFHLRDNTWSDGTPVTTADFVYAWQRGVDPSVGSKYSFFLYPVKNAKEITEGKAPIESLGISAIDDKTLKVELNNPTPYFISLLVNAVTYPVPKHIVEEYGKDWTRAEHIVSNGAFKMTEWKPQSRITLEKSDKYYDAGNVQLDKVIYYVSEDKNAELQRYRADELDWTADVPNEQIKWLQQNLKDELHIYNYLGTFYFGYNLTKPPFKDNPKLREALSLVIDRERIVKNITASGEMPAYSFVVPGISHYQPYVPEYASWDRNKRLEKAKALYSEAGYSKESPLRVEVLYNTNDNNKKIAIAVASLWKEALGVESSLINKEWKAYLNDRREYNTQIFRGSWIGDYDDANTFLDLFVTSGGSNTIGLADPEYDKLIADAAAETDAEKRTALLQEAEKRLIDNHSLIPVYFFVSKHLVKPYVKGYEENVMNHWPSKYIHLEK
ncbi:MAG: peptide ABC transporter substrate-binding protein [Cardiobacteriaceae bacterium]|nr:peptide ABC transporter substrate-binding protein [Cardiobacteriaceae bacterium]